MNKLTHQQIEMSALILQEEFLSTKLNEVEFTYYVCDKYKDTKAEDIMSILFLTCLNLSKIINKAKYERTRI